MPKRRLTTTAQKAAARRNLVQARKSRGTVTGQTGKNQLLYHRTTPANAASIAKHGFDPGKAVKTATLGRTALTRGKVDRSTFFSNKPAGDAARHGTALVSVQVPRKLVHRDPNFDTYKGETFFFVRNNDLQGRKIRRHL